MAAKHHGEVIVAGGGIAGLTMALTLHEIGVPVRVLESVAEVKPLGVGINLQPNAIRELQQLGLGDELERMAVRTKNVSMYSKHGGRIWTEQRGIWAGYRWPQYSVHRGHLQMLLYEAVLDRLGAAALQTGARVTSFENTASGVAVGVDWASGESTFESAASLIGADGIHSAIRRQMYPAEGAPVWAGSVMWRAATESRPFLDGATMVFIGNDDQKFVAYPISQPDPQTGLAIVNWIAELRYDPSKGFNKEDYTRRASVDEFLPQFENWEFDWIDLAALANGADRIYEYPMVDRDPIPSWTDGRVTLMGDAAHVMYPVGSNGASQAIVDARKIGRALIDHDDVANAMASYESEMLPLASNMVLRNRAGGPDHIMQMVEDRCGGVFDDITDVMSNDELDAYAAKYKTTAGFAITELNDSAPIIS